MRTGGKSPMHKLSGQRWPIRLALSALVVVVVCSCEFRKTGWEEEVLLNNSKVVRVERHDNVRRSQRIGDKSSEFILESRMSITDSNGRKPEWRDGLEILLLATDPVTGEYVVVCTATDEIKWRERGSPAPPYWQFRLRDGKWVEQPLDDFVFEMDVNMVFDRNRASKHSGVVPLATKAQWMSQYSAAKYLRTIKRDARLGID